MKITLNTSIPAARRAEAETTVKARDPKAEVIWRESRFPRYVILVEPSAHDVPDKLNSSIFDSEPTGSTTELTEILEQALKKLLGK